MTTSSISSAEPNPAHLPHYLGEITGIRIKCLGWAADNSGNLVAIRIVGSYSAVMGIWARVMSDKHGSLSLTIHPYSYEKVYANTKDYDYTSTDREGIQIPGTNEVAMIIFSKTLLGVEDGVSFTHLNLSADPSQDFLKQQMMERLHQITPYPLRDEWFPYLYQNGVEKRLCGHLSPGVGERPRHFLCRGFNMFFMHCADPGAWENIIKTGLRNKDIKITE